MHGVVFASLLLYTHLTAIGYCRLADIQQLTTCGIWCKLGGMFLLSLLWKHTSMVWRLVHYSILLYFYVFLKAYNSWTLIRSFQTVETHALLTTLDQIGFNGQNTLLLACSMLLLISLQWYSLLVMCTWSIFELGTFIRNARSLQMIHDCAKSSRFLIVSQDLVGDLKCHQRLEITLR